MQIFTLNYLYLELSYLKLSYLNLQVGQKYWRILKDFYQSFYLLQLSLCKNPICKIFLYPQPQKPEKTNAILFSNSSNTSSPSQKLLSIKICMFPSSIRSPRIKGIFQKLQVFRKSHSLATFNWLYFQYLHLHYQGLLYPESVTGVTGLVLLRSENKKLKKNLFI